MADPAVRDTRPKGVRKDAVALAAVGVIEDVGVEHLTMRKVAVRLGVTPMALYNHVRDKDDLLELAAEQVCAHVVVDETLAPRAQLSSLVAQLRELGAQHPRLLEGLLQARSDGAARITLRAVRLLADLGLSPRQVRDAHNAISFLVMGAAMAQRVSDVDPSSSRARAREVSLRDLAKPSDVGLLESLSQLPRVTVAAELDTAVELILRGVRES